MLVALLFSLVIPNTFAIQNINEVCSVLSICENIAVIRSQVAAIREEQERQRNILGGSSLSLESGNDVESENNGDLCTILSICNNLAALSTELASVRAEQDRQADLLVESCKPDTDSYPSNCYEALKKSQKSGVTEILVPEYSDYPFKVACDQESHGGGWTIVLRRTDGSEDFYREWKDYVNGFGRVDNEYFVGLSQLNNMTSERQELLVLMEDFDGLQHYEMYDNFKVGGEANNYTLESVGSFTGTAGDALTYHSGMQFQTQDHGRNPFADYSCSLVVHGAWWYNNCYRSHLTGLYGSERLAWMSSTYTGFLKTAIMMIRPKVLASANVE